MDKDDKMKNKKIIIIKAFNVSIWVLISLLSSYVLMKACTLYTPENMRQTIKNLGKEITLDIGMSVVKANSPMAKYEMIEVGSTYEYENSLLYKMLSVFPINKYVMKEQTNQVAVVESNSLSELFGNTYLASNISDEFGLKHQSNDDISQLDGDVSFITGDSYYESDETTMVEEDESVTASTVGKTYTLAELKDFNFLKSNFYIGEASAYIPEDVLNATSLLKKNMTMKIDSSKPQILILHTHSQEAFIDSRAGVEEDTIVGVGSYLEKILTDKYGIKVVHDKSKYDIVNGKLDRDKAYNVVGDKLPDILKENPSIEVIIDLHRDDGAKRVVTINGKKTAQFMFFNGISRHKSGPIEYLYNPNLAENLAFSLQMKLKADSLYPNLTKRIYLKDYRYNLHLKPKSLLIELGTDENTLEEAMNAMEPLADILYQVLTGETVE